MTYPIISPLTIDAVQAEAIRLANIPRTGGNVLLRREGNHMQKVKMITDAYNVLVDGSPQYRETTQLVVDLIRLGTRCLMWVEGLEGKQN